MITNVIQECRFYCTYPGFVGGAYFNQRGGSHTPICLPEHPQYGYYQSGVQNVAQIYGSEYRTSSFSIFKKLHSRDVPCVVCKTTRSAVIMIPGNVFLMSKKFSQYDLFVINQSLRIYIF